MRRLLATMTAAALLLAACGDSDDDDTATTVAPTSDGVDVVMTEFQVDAPTNYGPGAVDLVVRNDGEFPHEFKIIRADGYASLPKNDLGTVLEEELGEGAIVASVERFDAGETVEVSVDLEAGNYVFLCNIEFGPTSHAGEGQTLDVTVG